ncbi:hypothetical protein RI129_006906 [Pyrocoelia pectoralis]|uniref:Uncharacterized protein n=1 Tax=Pyrocoelia pectoralis TaxID=417401 RepID=A0AAN7VCK1_9COLE
MRNFIPKRLKRSKSEDILHQTCKFVPILVGAKSLSNVSWISPDRLVIPSSYLLEPASTYNIYIHAIALRDLFCQADGRYSKLINQHMETQPVMLQKVVNQNIVIEHAAAKIKVDAKLRELTPKLGTVIGEFLSENNELESIQDYKKFAKVIEDLILQVSIEPLKTCVDINKILTVIISHKLSIEKLHKLTDDNPPITLHLNYEAKRVQNLACLFVARQVVLAKLITDPTSLILEDIPDELPSLDELEDFPSIF